LSAAEIAGLLDLSTANVHQILSRSLRRLRDQGATPDEGSGRCD
jgi:DNA-directed RNA polymerase specialized sigma24 family protein